MKNFHEIFNSMYQGSKKIENTNNDQNRKRMGDNLKEMGKMKHSEAFESVKKNQTKMGRIENI